MTGKVQSELVIMELFFLEASPGLVELAEAAGNLCRHVAERDAVLEPGDPSGWEGADVGPELTDLIQLGRFVLPELRLDGHELARCQRQDVDELRCIKTTITRFAAENWQENFFIP